MWWKTNARLDALDEIIIVQNKRIKMLEDIALEYEKQFEEIRIRLSNADDWTKPSVVKDTDWLTRRKHLTDKYASEGEDFA